MICTKNLFLALFIPVFAVMSGGCATSHYLTMKADGQPFDESAFSPRFKERKCTKLIVIPPSGTARGAFETQIALFEREFLRKGLTVISGAITGRVVMEATVRADTKADEKMSDMAGGLSDLERALVMAKKTGADAILQLGEFRWTRDKEWTRFFIADPGDNSNFREVGNDVWRSWTGPRWTCDSVELVFVGKIVDVDNGEVLATMRCEDARQLLSARQLRGNISVQWPWQRVHVGLSANFRV